MPVKENKFLILSGNDSFFGVGFSIGSFSLLLASSVSSNSCMFAGWFSTGVSSWVCVSVCVGCGFVILLLLFPPPILFGVAGFDGIKLTSKLNVSELSVILESSEQFIDHK